jgi:hypothetical protein
VSLPVLFGSNLGGYSPRAVEKVRKAEEDMEVSVRGHELRARELAEIQMSYSRAAADATRVDIEEEIDILKKGLELAKGSAAATEIVARKLNELSSADSNRFRRIFGG